MEYIPSGTTHKNPLIGDNRCQYVRIDSDGTYWYQEDGDWCNTNCFKVDSIPSYMVSIKEIREEVY